MPRHKPVSRAGMTGRLMGRFVTVVQASRMQGLVNVRLVQQEQPEHQEQQGFSGLLVHRARKRRSALCAAYGLAARPR